MKTLFTICNLVLFFLIQTSVYSQDQTSVPPGSQAFFNRTPVQDHPGQVYTSTGILNVKIVESTSFNSGHSMDTVWRFVAESMGFTTSVVPQTFLDDTSFIQTTDILIIASGVINIPPNRGDAIKRFIKNNKNVYLQSEYLSTYSADSLFKNLVNSLGGNFNWVSTISGDLQPMTVLGSLSNTPNVVTPLSYFWYGVHGSGDQTIENYLRNNSGLYFGFVFTPPASGHGVLITNSDQDWVNHFTSPLLMKNILNRLANNSVGIVNINNSIPDQFSLEQNYPNPFNPSTTINFSIPVRSNVELKVFNSLGKEVRTLFNGNLEAGNFSYNFNASSDLNSGVYFYRLNANEFVRTKKFILNK